LDKQPKRKKTNVSFCTWNVRSLYRAGSLRAVVEEFSKYKLDLVGLQEVRWYRGGTKPACEYSTFFYYVHLSPSHTPSYSCLFITFKCDIFVTCIYVYRFFNLCLISYVFVGAGFPMHRNLIWSIVRPL
jgi:hypothetical protein